MLVLLLPGCVLTDSAPPPAPISEVEPIAAQPTPVIVAAAAVVGTPDPGITSKTNESLARQLASAKATFDSATTTADVALAYQLTLAVGEALTEFHYGNTTADVDSIAAAGPGMEVSWQGEGTVAVFQPNADAWKAKSTTTLGSADDAYFDMVGYVFGSASTSGWAVWEIRNWDYGGCSGLGKGVVLESMKRIHTATEAGNEFASHIANVREQALREITHTEPSNFQRCDPETVQPTADDKLQGEVQAILDTVPLSDGERAALVEAKPKLHGEVFQGG
jgi:hypothetical protein